MLKHDPSSPDLDPAIHLLRKGWMPGSSPRMTINMWRKLVAAVLAIACVPQITFAGVTNYQADAKLVTEATREGQVLWYTTLIVDQIVRPLISAFRANFPGIEVRFVRIDSGQQVTRLINESRVGRVQADVWSVIDGVAPLVQNGVAAQFDIASARGLPPTLVDPQRHWIATNLATRSLAYNTDLVAAAQAPRGYQDILEPRWKGALVWNPNAMTGAWGFIATVLRYMGEEAGLSYLRKLAKQDIVALPIATRAVLDRVIAGEYAIGLEMVNAHVGNSRAKGAPVRWVPLEAVTTTLQVAGLTKAAPHPRAGELFLDFITSRTGQEIFREANYIPMHPDIPAKDPSLKAEQGGYNSIVLTPEEVDLNARRYQKIYEEIFR